MIDLTAIAAGILDGSINERNLMDNLRGEEGFRLAVLKYVLDLTAAASTGGVTGDNYRAVQLLKDDTSTTSSATWVEIPGLDDLQVTTSDVASTVLVRASLHVACSAIGEPLHFRITRDGTPIGVGAAASNRTRSGETFYFTNNFGTTSVVLEVLDSPGSAGVHSYAVEWTVAGSGVTAGFINRGANDADSAGVGRTSSSLTATPYP